jgi:hypothetical protein
MFMYKSDERHDLKERPLIAGSRCYYTPTLVSRVCVEARVTLKSLMLFGRRYVAHCLPLAPAPAELELDPPLLTSSTSQAFDTFCCKYLEPPLLGSFISISRLCASSTSASVAVGFTLRIMRAWVARKGTISWRSGGGVAQRWPQRVVEAEHAPRSPASLLDRTASQPWLHLLLQMPRHCLERSSTRGEGAVMQVPACIWHGCLRPGCQGAY